MGWDHKKKLKIRLWGQKRSSGRNTANVGGYKFKCVTSKHLETTRRNMCVGKNKRVMEKYKVSAPMKYLVNKSVTFSEHVSGL